MPQPNLEAQQRFLFYDPVVLGFARQLNFLLLKSAGYQADTHDQNEDSGCKIDNVLRGMK